MISIVPRQNLSGEGMLQWNDKSYYDLQLDKKTNIQY